jgi:hypothetical protein
MTFCKALAGKDICMTEAGMMTMKANFASKKAKFVAARKAHLEKFNAIEKAFAGTAKVTIDVMSDMLSEAVSAGFLGVRMALNAVKRFKCDTFAPNGTFTMECSNLEDPKAWLKANGRNLRKDVVKRIIAIGMTIDEMAKKHNVTKDNIVRVLQAVTNTKTDDMLMGD